MHKNLFSYFFLIVSSCAVFLSGSYAPLWAKGELLVAPTRVVFDNRRRSAKLNLVNVGKEAETFRIQFIQRRMTDEGRIVEVKKALPGEQFSDKMVRYSPRQVTLQPGQSQAVRLILRKPANLAHGEYRSHLKFSSVQEKTLTSIENQKKAKGQQLSIKLTPLFSFSIPIIVRHGKTHVSINLNNIQLKHIKKKPMISFVVRRDGNRSVNGDFTVKFINQSGEKFVISNANGYSIYAPNKIRKMLLPIQTPPNVSLSNGKIEVTLHEKKLKGGRLLAQGEIEIP